MALRADRALAFRPDACLNAFRADYGCDICATACPVAAIRPDGFGVALSDACLECGQCAAACPTGALSAPEPVAAAPRAAVECARVPAAERTPGATVVACLGGLSTERLLESCAEGAARLDIVDRGLCADCALGGGRAEPWAEALAEARALAAGVSAEALPGVVAMPAPRRPEPLRSDGVDPARRGLFRRLAAEPEAPSPWRRLGAAATPKRRRRLDALARLDAAPAGAAPVVAVLEGCDLTGLCAAMCPTGALAFGVGEDRAVLAFDAARCIACGDCVAACPTKAMALDPNGPPPGAEPAVLAERATRACRKCETLFTPRAGEVVCPACVKSDDLMSEMSSLFP
ncbi:MAG: hypothetical protein EA355_16155 [Rhodobacteraceae bacterium]|nr:MAG: hypothetical protein EA355_16155 [Paracoccaceae bacterium]